MKHPVHAAADKIEPRMRKAFVRAAEKMRAGVSINDLALAIAAKDTKRALALLGGVEEALAPAATIVRDAFTRGGKLGADAVNTALGGRR